VNAHNNFLKMNHGIVILCMIICEIFNRANNVSSSVYIILSYVITVLMYLVLIGGFVRIYK